jgi:hypothetical protein
MASGRNTARYAPVPKPIRSLEDIEARLNTLLAGNFDLRPLASFTVILEGQTDLRYLSRAAELASQGGDDLLRVPENLAERGGAISLCTPGTPGAPHRGGTKQMVRLARELGPYVFTVEMVRGVLFVFDHDEAGQEAAQQITEYGFRANQHSITLDPREHPAACADKQVAIEDLLSLRIQQSFFATGGAWCSAQYEEGQLKRYQWGHASKWPLCDFVCTHGSIEDFDEVIQLLRRIRRVFGFA